MGRDRMGRDRAVAASQAEAPASKPAVPVRAGAGTPPTGAVTRRRPDAVRPQRRAAAAAAAGGAAPQGPVPAGLEQRRPRQLQYSAPSEGGGVEHRGDSTANPFANVGRNDLCPCGSGRKYKRCHGDPRNA